MKIYSISKILALPAILLLLAILILGWLNDGGLSAYIIVPAVVLMILYIFHGQIDYWWLSKHPIPLDHKLQQWLSKYFISYNLLNEEARQKFENRLMLYLNGRLFASVGQEVRDVPEDVKASVAAHGVLMTLHIDDFLIGEINRVYLYKHPFPSPDHPYLHTVEVNADDGVIILSLEQLTNAIFFPDKHYNVAFHAYAEAILTTKTKFYWPDCTNTWDEITQISGWSEKIILSQTGLNQVSLLTVNIVLFFTHRQNYKMHLPRQFESFKSIFGEYF